MGLRVWGVGSCSSGRMGFRVWANSGERNPILSPLSDIVTGVHPIPPQTQHIKPQRIRRSSEPGEEHPVAEAVRHVVPVAGG